jgi:prephenate dehydrogenase
MIGIIGYGRFGRLMAAYLAEDFPVAVASRTAACSDMDHPQITLRPLEKVCRQKIVVLAVPISTLEDVLKRTASLFGDDTLVVDVSSVKTHPVRWMESCLPQHVAILATHPMFGPDSAADSLDGHKIVVCPVKIHEKRFAAIKTYLSSKGLVVIETTPEEHDRQIAVSLALTHFIGRSLSEFGAHDLKIDTEGYKRLLHILGVVENDTWQLFEDMNKYNPYASHARAGFMAAMRKIEKKLET